MGLWPEKQASDLSLSLESLAKNIRDLVVTSLTTVIGASGQDHSRCAVPSFKAEVDEVMASIRSPVNATHLRVKKPMSTTTPIAKGIKRSVDGSEKQSLVIKLSIPKPAKK